MILCPECKKILLEDRQTMEIVRSFLSSRALSVIWFKIVTIYHCNHCKTYYHSKSNVRKSTQLEDKNVTKTS